MSARLFDPRKKDGTFPFEYIDSANTDVRETIRRARERLERERAAEQQTVRPIIRLKRSTQCPST